MRQYLDESGLSHVFSKLYNEFSLKADQDQVGSLSQLETSAKSSLVAAINEILAKDTEVLSNLNTIRKILGISDNLLPKLDEWTTQTSSSVVLNGNGYSGNITLSSAEHNFSTTFQVTDDDIVTGPNLMTDIVSLNVNYSNISKSIVVMVDSISSIGSVFGFDIINPQSSTVGSLSTSNLSVVIPITENSVGTWIIRATRSGGTYPTVGTVQNLRVVIG